MLEAEPARRATCRRRCRESSQRGSTRFPRPRRSCSSAPPCSARCSGPMRSRLLLETDEWLLEERLHALERKEFVRREHRSAVAGARQYVFVHALVLDGAYGQMPRAARARAHERAAEWIDRFGRPRRGPRRDARAPSARGRRVRPRRRAGRRLPAPEGRAARSGMRATARGLWERSVPRSPSTSRSRSLDPAGAEDPYLLLRLGRALLIVHGRGEEELEAAAAALARSDPAAAAEAEITRRRDRLAARRSGGLVSVLRARRRDCRGASGLDLRSCSWSARSRAS